MKDLGKNAGSWKTTAAGVFAALGALGSALSAALDSDPATVADWPLVGVAIAAAVGLFVSRDNDVSSEDAGAR